MDAAAAWFSQCKLDFGKGESESAEKASGRCGRKSLVIVPFVRRFGGHSRLTMAELFSPWTATIYPGVLTSVHRTAVVTSP